MKINNEIIAELNADILSVVGVNVPLKKSGTSHVGLCPFHSEKTPSFRVSEGRNKYKCFGCGKGGDAINFVQSLNGIGFKEACKEIATIKGMSINIDEVFEINHNEADIFNTYEELQKECVKTDLSDYLLSRGISKQTQSFFEIGYCSVFKCDLELGRKAGLISNEFNLMSNRLTLPIKNRWGKYIAFGGRTLDPKFKEKGIPKYINTGNSIVFNKSDNLFNFWNAIEHIKDSKVAVVVEGYFDVIGLWDKGIYNAVATCGTSFTSQHAALLKKTIGDGGTVVFAYDNDGAGFKVLIRSIHTCLEVGLNARFIILNQDPDEAVVKIGGTAFQKLIDNAIYFHNAFCTKYEKGNEIEKAELLGKLKSTLSKCKEVGFKINFIRLICEKLHLTPSVFDENLRKLSFESKINFVSLSDEIKLLKQMNAVKHLKIGRRSIVQYLVENTENYECFSTDFNEVIANISGSNLQVLDKYEHEPLNIEPHEAYEHLIKLYDKFIINCLIKENKEKISSCTDAEELKILLSAEKKIKEYAEKL